MERTKALRRDQTDAERTLWSRLRAQQLGVKFRGQHPLDGYIADFACIERRLIVELDGSQHAEQTHYDQRRTQALQAMGFRVLRFWNNDALQRTDDVLEAIVHALSEPPPPHPDPLPPLRRGKGSKARSGNVKPQCAESPGVPGNPLPQAALGGEGRVRGPSVTAAQKPAAGRSANASAFPKARALHLRADLYACIRRFFAERHVLEVDTPILSAAGNTDPNIRSFHTRFSGHVDAGARQRFLRTSAEFPLKRLLAEGIGDCYELGRVFRDGEAGGRHNPEFTMLEWYRVGFDHHRLMREIVALVQSALALRGRQGEVYACTYRELFQDNLDLDPLTVDEATLRALLAEYGIDPDGLSRDDWLDLLITHRLQPQFPHDRITVVHDYPATQCALAKIRDDDPPVAERFEVYLGPYELANGYHELNDAAEQRARFQRDNAVRRARGDAELPLDEHLLAALDSMPDCAGVALGVERLLMCLLGTDAIADVLCFAFADA